MCLPRFAGIAKEKLMSTPQLETIVKRHAHLDQIIDQQTKKAGVDNLSLSRLKKERLALKDQIASIN
jgi:hypothetical protein